MAKLPTLTDVVDMVTAPNTINTNNEEVEAAFTNTLSRDGSTPNDMGADLDMGTNDILNTGNIDTTSLTVAGVNLVSATAVPNWEGAWLTSTAYVLNDIVREAGSTYICTIAHTSGTFSTDLTSVKWELFAQQGAAGDGTGDMLAANNLSDVDNVATSRTNLGLGTAATTAVTDYMIKATPVLGGHLDTNGKQVIETTGADVASATALPLLADGQFNTVTGTSTITSMDSIGVGKVKMLTFSGALTLTHHATDLKLPGDANVTTVAGDRMWVHEYATGDYECLSYLRADGSALSTTGGYSNGPLFLTANTTTLYTHGLGYVPTEFYLDLSCVVATENWAVGDSARVDLRGTNHEGTTFFIPSGSTTQFGLVIPPFLRFLNKTTRAGFILTATPDLDTNFKFTITAK